jgi:O-antigen/teichoic acid export membrane protein
LMLFLGAIANLGLNYFLIPIMGIKGAALATLLGFVLTVSAAILLIVIHKKLVYFKKTTYLILIIFCFTFVFFNIIGITFVSMVIGIVYLITCILIYHKDILKLLAKRR